MAALLLCLCILIPGTVRAASDNPVPEAKKGVVCIYGGIYYDSRGRVKYRDGAGSGTGFGVHGVDGNAQVFVTNEHVVHASVGKEDYVYVCIDGADLRDEATLIKCKILYADSKLDVAVIQAEAPVGGVAILPLCPAENMETGEYVFALGFPGIADDVADENNFTVEDVTVTNGVISRYMTVGGQSCMMHTANVNHGNSGGPLINEYGEVIGINTFIYTDTENADKRNYAIYIDYAMEALDSLGISYTLGTGQEPVPTEATTLPETTQAETTGEHTQDEEEESGSDKLVTIAICAGVLLLVGGGVVLALTRRKKKPAPKAREAEARLQETAPAALTSAQPFVQAAPAHSVMASAPQPYYIYAAGSALQGNSWQLTATLFAGRDPAGSIVFPANTPGVSRSHCRIDLVNGRVVVMDLGSSYGTFVNGRRIPPNEAIRIERNTQIMLGGDAAVLVLR